MFKPLNKQQIAFEIIQDLLVSASLTITALLVSKTELSPALVVKETCFAWVVNMMIGFVVPEKRLGEFLCGKLQLKDSLSFFFTMLIIVLINVVGISLCVVLKNVGFHRQFFGVWIELLPVLLLVGYPAALIWFPLTNGIIDAIFKKRS